MSITSARAAGSPGYDAGEVIARRYELVRELGAGGMGVVWLAQDRVLNVEVALKLILHPSREAPARAQTEARAAARLAHPAVCRVFDHGRTVRGDPFVVTELLEGETLEALLERRRRLPACEAVQTLLPILDALDIAHASGIVHRDVKPSNIFLARLATGVTQPKLLDFGIARWIEEKTKNTTTGSIVGTPDYMSPEQARGSREIGAASDIWNFCATLHEALTGAAPFQGQNYNAVLWAIQNTDALPITAYAAGDEQLAEIVSRGLRRESSERWPSARALRTELSRWLLSRGVETDLCGRSMRQSVGPRERPAELRAIVSAASRPARTLTPATARGSTSRARRAYPLARAALTALGLVALASSAYAVKLVSGAGSGALTASTEHPAPAQASDEPVLADHVVPAPAQREPGPVGASLRGAESKSAPRVQPRPPAPARAASPSAPPASATVAAELAASGRRATPSAAPAAEALEPLTPAEREANALGYDFGF